MAIGSTTFDGASNGPVWQSLAPHIESVFSHLGAGPESQLSGPRSWAWSRASLVIGGFYRLGIRGMVARGGGSHLRRAARSASPTRSIPIAFAYALAHYFSLLVFQGQALVHLVSDPLGHGADLFGTADAGSTTT